MPCGRGISRICHLVAGTSDEVAVGECLALNYLMLENVIYLHDNKLKSPPSKSYETVKSFEVGLSIVFI